MGIPKPPLSGHLSPNPPHRNPSSSSHYTSFLSLAFSLSFFLSLTLFLSPPHHTDVSAIFDAFLLLLPHLYSLHWHQYFHPTPLFLIYNPHSIPILYILYYIYYSKLEHLRVLIYIYIYVYRSLCCRTFCLIITMDNFPVPHFLTSNASTRTTNTTSMQPKFLATTTSTHDDSHNSQLVSSIYEPVMSFLPYSTAAAVATTTTSTSPQYCYPTPLYFHHQDQGLQFPVGVYPGTAGHRSSFAYRPLMVAGQHVGAILVGVSEEEERRILDAWTTKVARSRRRLARQRSLNFITRNYSPSSSSSSSSSSTHGAVNSSIIALGDSREPPSSGAGGRDLYTFDTPDKKVG